MWPDWQKLLTSLAQKTWHFICFQFCECGHCSQGSFLLESVSILWHLIWVYIVCSNMHVRILRVNIVEEQLEIKEGTLTFPWRTISHVVYQVEHHPPSCNYHSAVPAAEENRLILLYHSLDRSAKPPARQISITGYSQSINRKILNIP